MLEPNSFAVDVESVKAETDKALLCVLETGEEIWIPKSVITDDSEVWRKGQEGSLVVEYWWADKRGWT